MHTLRRIVPYPHSSYVLNRIPNVLVGKSPHGVRATLLDCDFVVSEFENQSGHYIPLRMNTLKKGMNLLIPPCPFTWMALAFNNP